MVIDSANNMALTIQKNFQNMLTSEKAQSFWFAVLQFKGRGQFCEHNFNPYNK